MSDMFEYLSPEEFERQTGKKPKSTYGGKAVRRKREAVTEPRINTTWYALPHVMGFCECPAHDEIQKLLTPQANVYRQQYPTRMTYEIQPGMPICRDCFLHEGDKM